MQNLSSVVLVALGGAFVFIGGYHALIVRPRMLRLTSVLGAHDTLIGGGASAVDRLTSLEAGTQALQRAHAELERRLDALETQFTERLSCVGFVRYNAFEDAGGPDLSYALALISRSGEGVVLSSIYSREQTRTFGKAVSGFEPAQDASEEERAAIAKARAAAS